MNNELFGVFGDRSTFESVRSPTAFDRVVEGPTLTVGIRDVALDIPGRTTVASDGRGTVVIWGEVYHQGTASPAQWLLDSFPERGTDALGELNGSYLAVVDVDGGETLVASDPIRTRECFYSDDSGTRVFGTDPTMVAETIDSHSIEREALAEFVLFGVVLGNRTVYEELGRVPFDGYLDASTTGQLSRFTYEPREFDYAGELADRLERAFQRRSSLPGTAGVMLSGGYDSRAILSGIPDVDEAYTIGTHDAQEVVAAEKVAEQYGATHRVISVDDRYLNTTPQSIRYGQGIRESLQVHQAGYEPQMSVDTVYHGLLFDTLLRGHFQQSDAVDVFDKKVTFDRPAPDPDPVGGLLDKFGYMEEAEADFERFDLFDVAPKEFARRAVMRQFEALSDRYDTIHDSMAVVGIQNQPSYPFQTHLTDQFVDSFVSVDRDLLEWHCMTPPEHRTTGTFLEALQQFDPDILRHRPPDRPHDSHVLNQLERFARRKLPFVTAFESSWPDRRELYRRNDLDRELFSQSPRVWPLRPRIKLRVNDAVSWISETRGEAIEPNAVLNRSP